MEHALSCTKGGFPSIRHNKIRNMTATLLTEMCHDVCIEPGLQLVTNEALMGGSANRQDGAWLAIAANAFWGGTFEKIFIDVRVFNPHVPSNRHTQLPSCYRKHEQVKKCAYEQRIREVEHTSFTPLVISATGSLANEASILYKRMSSACLKMGSPLQQHIVLAALLFGFLPPIYVLLSRPSKELGCHVDMPSGFPQWSTSSTPNRTFHPIQTSILSFLLLIFFIYLYCYLSITTSLSYVYLFPPRG